MQILAPITLFVYNRPWHTQQTIEALRKNELASQSELFIYADGEKTPNDPKVAEVRAYIKTITGFKNITIIERDKSWGLADNIIDGVTTIVNNYGKIIVLEDDIVTSVGFLKYMNDALSVYENEEKVGCIHSWNYNFDKKHFIETTFFLKGADCWGWATWQRAWKLFNKNGQELLNEISSKKLEFEFNRKGTHDYVDMLKGYIKGSNNSWAIRWHASLFVKNIYCLQPSVAIVKNIGLDGSGTHCGINRFNQVTTDYINIKKLVIEESDVFFKFYKNINKEKEMKNNFKTKLKLFIPPIIFKIKNKLIKKQLDVKEENKYGWFGNYATWDEAKKDCTGYDSDIILQKVKTSLLKVKNGQAVYERDSVIFDKKEYSENLLTGLLQAASENDYKLNVLDFGGSLGSTYYQNKEFLKHLKQFSWNIVEQQNFVKEGKTYFEDDSLKFYYNIDDVIKDKTCNIILISNTLQYIEKPYLLIKKILKYNFKYIIFDTTAFLENNNDIITVQKVPPEIYNANYPAWFFNESKFLSFLKEEYNLINDFESFHTKPIMLNNKKAYWKGFIFKKKN